MDRLNHNHKLMLAMKGGMGSIPDRRPCGQKSWPRRGDVVHFQILTVRRSLNRAYVVTDMLLSVLPLAFTSAGEPRPNELKK